MEPILNSTWMHLNRHTATQSENHYFFLIGKYIKINENTKQFPSQMDYEKCTIATLFKLGLIMAPQKSL